MIRTIDLSLYSHNKFENVTRSQLHPSFVLTLAPPTSAISTSHVVHTALLAGSQERNKNQTCLSI